MAVSVFLDTSVLLAGLVDFGSQSRPAHLILHAVAERKLTDAATAWHCCLEFYSVATRLPPEYRLSPADAHLLLTKEVLGRMPVHDLPAAQRGAFLQTTLDERTIGGRVYDVHIAEIARAAGTTAIVTDNRRHFLASLKHGIRVETPAEFLKAAKLDRR
jgi:predicted nucleic acid-binding protein